MKKRLLATFLSMAMVAGLATGCSTPGSGKDGGASDGEKVFRYATNTLPTTLDPNKGQGMVDNEIQHAITEGLVRNTGGDIQPGIAESWDISDDGLTYTFHLRDDAVWSDGEPVTAANFEYSWKRLVNPETASVYAFIGDCLKNGQAIEKGEMAVDELGVKATDDTTLEVTLEHPTSYFLSLIGSSGEFAPIRQDIVEKYGTDFAATADKNVYCGPFVMTSSENNVWIFEKNENYWNKDSIKLDRCELNYVENADTQLSMYEAGDLDYVQISTAYVPEYKDQAQEYANGNIDFCYINQGSDNPVLANKNFRLALNYALNRNDYNKLANSDTFTPFNAAMQELGIAKASDITVEVVTTDADSSKRIVETLQEQWQNALGINIKIRQVTYADIYGEVLPNHDFEIGYGGWASDYDDPYSYLELFKSDSSYNYSLYKNEEVDALLNASTDEADTDKRMDELNQAEQLILADGAFVPLQSRNIYYMLDEDTTGVVFYYCSLNIDWVYADVQ